jgi:hypothetical protein
VLGIVFLAGAATALQQIVCKSLDVKDEHGITHVAFSPDGKAVIDGDIKAGGNLKVEGDVEIRGSLKAKGANLSLKTFGMGINPRSEPVAIINDTTRFGREFTHYVEFTEPVDFCYISELHTIETYSSWAIIKEDAVGKRWSVRFRPRDATATTGQAYGSLTGVKIEASR